MRIFQLREEAVEAPPPFLKDVTDEIDLVIHSHFVYHDRPPKMLV